MTMQSKASESVAMEMESSGFRRIVVAYDGSEFAKRALRVAESLAKQYDSSLIIVQVIADEGYLLASSSIGPGVQTINPLEVVEATKAAAEKELLKIVRSMKRRNIDARAVVRDGVLSVVNELAEFASTEGAELLVVGTRGLGGLKKLLMGSVSEGLVTHANCSVLVVR
jgi:nucleotide-binding universal stress UspA family protein